MAHTIRSAISENPVLHANFTALCVTETQLSPIESLFYIAGIGIFDPFCSCDLDLDPMTFIYELEPYSLETHRMCENELLTSRLSKVIA